MIFFDAYIAYKPMSLLFLVAGMTWAQQEMDAHVRIGEREVMA
jgi:hypothetical protein